MLKSKTVAFFRSVLMTVQDILRMCKAVCFCSSVWELFQPFLHFKSFARTQNRICFCYNFLRNQDRISKELMKGNYSTIQKSLNDCTFAIICILLLHFYFSPYFSQGFLHQRQPKCVFSWLFPSFMVLKIIVNVVI